MASPRVGTAARLSLPTDSSPDRRRGAAPVGVRHPAQPYGQDRVIALAWIASLRYAVNPGLIAS
ncbi:hypothetical protein Misp04_15500 [Micromonospora sp. NBRC 101691]|nr:hypothetical protein Misp04_15500 [Micromonospora sp. NBRC 101691]